MRKLVPQRKMYLSLKVLHAAALPNDGMAIFVHGAALMHGFFAVSSVAVGLFLGVLLVFILNPPAYFRKHVLAITGLGKQHQSS